MTDARFLSFSLFFFSVNDLWMNLMNILACLWMCHKQANRQWLIFWIVVISSKLIHPIKKDSANFDLLSLAQNSIILSKGSIHVDPSITDHWSIAAASADQKLRWNSNIQFKYCDSSKLTWIRRQGHARLIILLAETLVEQFVDSKSYKISDHGESSLSFGTVGYLLLYGISLSHFRHFYLFIWWVFFMKKINCF